MKEGSEKVDSRRQKPKNDEIPSMPYDVTIVTKTKGLLIFVFIYRIGFVG